MTPEHKRTIWNHVREMATSDPAYALTAAAWYAQNEPWLFKDLRRHLQEWIAANQPADSPSGKPS
ncbi:hypothetical protein GCM10028796_17330 [Ramlibacter monticola]|uniref:Uncharacterized protein n=1 Tax=Ramlibacter monticola TaxID=1926872 RepID=A0A937CSG7_9BURK|nr:hypothetical protein [Ramlibacter monticola]MBL0390559.1 hypothetical protein [Ramlibacter monticola]